MTGIYSIHVVFVKILTMLIASSVPHLFRFPDVLFHHLFPQFLLPSVSRKWVLPLSGWVLEHAVWRTGGSAEGSSAPIQHPCGVLVE